MAMNQLTLDEAAEREIVTHRKNTRTRLSNYADVLESPVSGVWTAQLVVAADLEIGVVYQNVKGDRDKYNALDAAFNTEYAGYAASQWKTDLDTDVTELDTLLSWLVTAFNNNFKAVDPADTYLIEQLSEVQKGAFAVQIRNTLG